MNTLGPIAVSQQRQGCRDEIGKKRYRRTESAKPHMSAGEEGDRPSCG